MLLSTHTIRRVQLHVEDPKVQAMVLYIAKLVFSGQ